MILESAQLLCTAINEHGGLTRKQTGNKANGKPKYEYYFKSGHRAYSPTHVNHPSNVWARKTRANYMWLYKHFIALCNEYTSRYGKKHKCTTLVNDLFTGQMFIPEGELTDFANCAAHSELGLNFKDVQPVSEAYKRYLSKRWKTDKRKPTWYREVRDGQT